MLINRRVGHSVNRSTLQAFWVYRHSSAKSLLRKGGYMKFFEKLSLWVKTASIFTSFEPHWHHWKWKHLWPIRLWWKDCYFLVWSQGARDHLVSTGGPSKPWCYPMLVWMCSEASFPATEVNEKTGTVVRATHSAQASNLTFAWNCRNKQTNNRSLRLSIDVALWVKILQRLLLSFCNSVIYFFVFLDWSRKCSPFSAFKAWFCLRIFSFTVSLWEF